MLWKDLNTLPYEQFHKICEAEFRQYPDCWKYHSNKKFNIPPANPQDEQHFSSDYDCLVKNNSTILTKYRYPHNSQLLTDVGRYFGFRHTYVCMNLQKAGMLLPLHYDRNRCFDGYMSEESRTNASPGEIVKLIYFLQDQQPGQMFQLGSEFLQWKANDLFEWKWWAPHASANCSIYDRSAMTIIGIK
jgi:hypothetical protein